MASLHGTPNGEPLRADTAIPDEFLSEVEQFRLRDGLELQNRSQNRLRYLSVQANERNRLCP